MTMKNNTGFRLPAEWETDSAVLLSWPHAGTDWAYILDDAQRCVAEIARAVASVGRKVIVIAPDPHEVTEALGDISAKGLLTVYPYLTNDTWTRDYGPLTLLDDTGSPMCVDYQFNGWGLKFASDRDNLATGHLVADGLISAPVCDRLDYTLEGGSVDIDTDGTVITTSECMLSLNRNGHISREAVERELISTLGASRVIWLDHGSLKGDDTDSHIDTLARFAPGHTLLYNVCADPEDPNYDDIAAMGQQIEQLAPAYGLKTAVLPLPAPIHDADDGHQLPATYANFLALPEAVLMPVYGQPSTDSQAMEIIGKIFDRPVIPVDCRALIRQHGSLHCMTMQIPLQALNIK